MKGLYLVDGNTIKYFNKQTGLPSDEVYSLFYDRKKNQLAIGSSGGITFLDIDLFDNAILPQLQVKIMAVKAGIQFTPTITIWFLSLNNEMFPLTLKR